MDFCANMDWPHAFVLVMGIIGAAVVAVAFFWSMTK